ncbi:MAG: hypothetical protein M0R03_21370 [Novosphingobium sp.]|nr:hypothetical protein [Novosphingobium sp.]
MIENIKLSTIPDKDGLTVIYFDIIYNDETYKWEDHIKSFNGKSLDDYLNDKLDEYKAEIDEKESLWDNHPKTKTIDDGIGELLEIEISKSDVVSWSAPCRRNILEKIQKETELLIDDKMPQWRLNRWRRYYDLTQKVLEFGYNTLNDIEKIEYDCFPDPGETHEICQQYVPLALQWCIDCINAHKDATVKVFNATTIEELLEASKIDYPTWSFN